MFGHDDTQATNDQDQNGNQNNNGFTPPADLSVNTSLGSTPPAPANNDQTATTAPTTPEPAVDDQAEKALNEAASKLSEASAPASSPSAAPEPSAPSQAPDNDDLLNIKLDALEQLSPLVEHLEQTPEEKFRTTMMMIQATDDHTKIKTAYEAAKQIEDKKVQAQALLDIVNEINYFTQQKTN